MNTGEMYAYLFRFSSTGVDVFATSERLSPFGTFLDLLTAKGTFLPFLKSPLRP